MAAAGRAPTRRASRRILTSPLRRDTPIPILFPLRLRSQSTRRRLLSTTGRLSTRTAAGSEATRRGLASTAPEWPQA